MFVMMMMMMIIMSWSSGVDGQTTQTVFLCLRQVAVDASCIVMYCTVLFNVVQPVLPRKSSWSRCAWHTDDQFSRLYICSISLKYQRNEVFFPSKLVEETFVRLWQMKLWCSGNQYRSNRGMTTVTGIVNGVTPWVWMKTAEMLTIILIKC